MNTGDKQDYSAGRRINILILAVIIGLLLFIESYDYLLFHCFAEIFTVVVASSIFVVVWNSREYHVNGYLTFIGVAYLFVGGLNLIHTMAYKGMDIFRIHGSDPATQLWIAGRYVQSISLLAAPILINKKLKAEYFGAAFAALTALILLSIFRWKAFPVCFVEGKGLTEFKIYSEYIICAILATAILFHYAKRRCFEPNVLWFLITSMSLAISAELVFTLYTNVFDHANMLGHLLTLISFYLIYRAIVVTGLVNPYELLFRDLKKSREEYKESELKYRSIFESAANLIVLMDRQGMILDCNERSVQILGYSPAEIRGRNIADIIVVRQRDIMRNFIGETLRNGYVHERDFVMVRKDAAEVDVGLYCSLGGDGDRITGIIEDITDIKHMAHTLLAAKEAAESASRSKSDFLANMSHELRTPLNAIIGFSEFLMKGFSDELSEKHLDYINRIYTSGHHLLSLINDILDLSKIEAGKMSLYAEEIDLHGTLDYGMTLLREKAMAHGIRMEKDFDGAPKTIVADLRKLKQILFNLISNALKYTPDGGTVGVRARTEGDFVRITVWDTGVGISKDILETLFLPFERDPKIETDRIEGTGLGLPLVRRLVKLHGGSVWAESEVGKGSHFHFTIPLKPMIENTVKAE